MHLQHIHLPNRTPYTLANQIQSLLVALHLSAHHPTTHPVPTSIPSSLRPHPTLLTFVTPPTYTSGRRQSLTAQQISQLETGPPPAAYAPSPRGGLLTFHGPGQLTAYLILHLRTHGLSPRCFVRFLEDGVIRTIGSYGVQGWTRGEYPGVWVRGRGARVELSGGGDGGTGTAVQREGDKIASVGMHIRRGVTGFGVGLNVVTDPLWWRRFTACGIEGVNMVRLADSTDEDLPQGEGGAEEVVADRLALEVRRGLEERNGAGAREETHGLVKADRDVVEALVEAGKHVDGGKLDGM